MTAAPENALQPITDAAPPSGWDVFISYSRSTSLPQAEWLRQALEAAGKRVFKDDAVLQGGDRWLEGIASALARCSHFVVLLGPEGLTRWVGGETSVALTRYFSAQHEGERPRIIPVLMHDTPATVVTSTFLAQFQMVHWPAEEAATPAKLLAAITSPKEVLQTAPRITGCPYRGLAAFQQSDAQLFFGRERDVLACLGCLGDPSPRQPGGIVVRGPQYRRWLSIVGGSGAGKSSLMRAGLMPLVKAGALSARTGWDDWVMTEPMLPGEEPLRQLAQALGAALLPDVQRDTNALAERFLTGNDAVLSDWINDRLADYPARALLLTVDQFEELFTLSTPIQRQRFDALLSHALNAPGARLHLLSTCRSDFAHRIAEELPQLGPRYNDLSRSYTLAPMGLDDLRRAIESPAALAGLDVSEITQPVLDDAREDLAGALPLVQHALATLWNEPRSGVDANHLRFSAYERAGRLAGMVAREADAVLEDLAKKSPAHRHGGLELLLALSHYQRDQRHTRQHLSWQAAVMQAGLGDPARGEEVLLALSASEGLRLITISDSGKEARVDLIHEALLRTPAAKSDASNAQPAAPAQPYWPTLVNFLIQHKDRDLHRQNFAHATEVRAQAGWLGRWFNASGPLELIKWWPLRHAASTDERRHFRHSVIVQSLVWSSLACLLAGGVAGMVWAERRNLPMAYIFKALAWTLNSSIDVPRTVPIPPGTFTIGCVPDRDETAGIQCDADDKITREVTLQAPCEMGVHEVTYEQFDRFVYTVQETWEGRDRDLPAYPTDPTGRRGQVPVVNVSWLDAKAYTDWISGVTGQKWRLPTEEEWEYAARGIHDGKIGGMAGPYWWGKESPAATASVTARANCNGCDGRFRGRSAPVGSYPANPFGLHDTVGNVWEWTGTGVGTSTPAATDDDKVPRVLRGGSWNFSPSYARASFRFGSNPDNRNSNFGFRVCRASPIEPLAPGAAGH